MNWASFTARAVVWIATSVCSVVLIRDEVPSVSELRAAVSIGLILTGLPGFAFLYLIRTWTGTFVGGAGFAAAWFSLFLYISAESEQSSTAGIGVIALPFVTAIPVAAVFAVESARWKKRPPAAR